jgi:hypothetical protein
MFSLFNQIRRWQLYLAMLLPSSTVIVRILDATFWLLGIQVRTLLLLEPLVLRSLALCRRTLSLTELPLVRAHSANNDEFVRDRAEDTTPYVCTYLCTYRALILDHESLARLGRVYSVESGVWSLESAVWSLEFKSGLSYSIREDDASSDLE